MGNSIGGFISNIPVDILEDNGIRFLGKIIPQEILCHIFTFVPARDLIMSVTRVCKHWNGLLSDYHFWFTKLQVEGFVLSEDTRTRLIKEDDETKVLRVLKLLSSHHLQLNENLIKNPSGKDKMKYWTVRHGGDGLCVESHPVGSDPIPEEAGLPTQHCFVTSYGKCTRLQDVDLQKLGFNSFIMDMLKPKIIISEWVCARWDCNSQSKLFVSLIGKNSKTDVKLEWSSEDEGVVNRQWYELRKVVTEYPDDLHKIRYCSEGKDRQFWAGHYGAKSAGSSVKIVL